MFSDLCRVLTRGDVHHSPWYSIVLDVFHQLLSCTVTPHHSENSVSRMDRQKYGRDVKIREWGVEDPYSSYLGLRPTNLYLRPIDYRNVIHYIGETQKIKRADILPPFSSLMEHFNKTSKFHESSHEPGTPSFFSVINNDNNKGPWIYVFLNPITLSTLVQFRPRLKFQSLR